MAMNPHVAISFGVGPLVIFGVSNFQGTLFSIPVGLLGVSAFL